MADDAGGALLRMPPPGLLPQPTTESVLSCFLRKITNFENLESRDTCHGQQKVSACMAGLLAHGCLHLFTMSSPTFTLVCCKIGAPPAALKTTTTAPHESQAGVSLEGGGMRHTFDVRCRHLRQFRFVPAPNPQIDSNAGKHAHGCTTTGREAEDGDGAEAMPVKGGAIPSYFLSSRHLVHVVRGEQLWSEIQQYRQGQ